MLRRADPPRCALRAALQVMSRLNRRGPRERALYHGMRKKYGQICARLAMEVRPAMLCPHPSCAGGGAAAGRAGRAGAHRPGSRSPGAPLRALQLGLAAVPAGA